MTKSVLLKGFFFTISSGGSIFKQSLLPIRERIISYYHQWIRFNCYTNRDASGQQEIY